MVQHMVDCERFKSFSIRADCRTLSEIIECNCGEAWQVRVSPFDREENNEFFLFLESIRQGLCGEHNVALTKYLDNIRGKRLRLAEEKIEKEKIEKNKKRMRNPITSLELE